MLWMTILIISLYLLIFISARHITENNKRKRKEKSSYANDSIDKTPTLPRKKDYYKKPFMTKTEYYFYSIFKKLEDEFDIVIQPQVNLATIIDKPESHYQNELYRNIDFAIFTSDYKDLLLLIEINDRTHNTFKRRKRDYKVDQICDNANIKLIKYYTNMPNEKNYVQERIRRILINDGIKKKEKFNINDNITTVIKSF